MLNNSARLGEIAADLKADKSVRPVTVRQFLWWFGAQRRGYSIVWGIRQQLKRAGLVTLPDFETAYIDSAIGFGLASLQKPKATLQVDDASSKSVVELIEPETDPVIEAAQDPTYTVSKLAAANKKVVSVKPDATLREAITLLMSADFSQLAVMTSEKEVKGIISWKGIGERLGYGIVGTFVREFMDGHEEISHSASMFDAIPRVVRNDYVLVRAEDKSISGIITSADLSDQFLLSSEPFLLLSEIENLLRGMIEGSFSKAELKSACELSDKDRSVEGPADLNFGEYIRLLENEERWGKFDVAVDRSTFCRKLDSIRRIRNDVMHFDPDGISEDDLKALRDFARFIKRLTTIKLRN